MAGITMNFPGGHFMVTVRRWKGNVVCENSKFIHLIECMKKWCCISCSTFGIQTASLCHRATGLYMRQGYSGYSTFQHFTNMANWTGDVHHSNITWLNTRDQASQRCVEDEAHGMESAVKLWDPSGRMSDVRDQGSRKMCIKFISWHGVTGFLVTSLRYDLPDRERWKFRSASAPAETHRTRGFTNKNINQTHA